MFLRGQCHCGNLSFEVTWVPAPEVIAARACDCSFCVMHGGLWTSTPHASLLVKVVTPGLVSAYEFGTRTAQFQVCTRCGIVPIVTCRIDDRVYGIVNVNTFVGVDRGLIRPGTVSFQGESVEQRLARRARNWIPSVRYA